MDYLLTTDLVLLIFRKYFVVLVVGGVIFLIFHTFYNTLADSSGTLTMWVNAMNECDGKVPVVCETIEQQPMRLDGLTLD